MKNQHVQQLQAAKASGYNQGYRKGRDKTLEITTVALNDAFGFGRKRLVRLNNEINRLIEKYFQEDNEIAEEQLAKRIKQIMEGK